VKTPEIKGGKPQAQWMAAEDNLWLRTQKYFWLKNRSKIHVELHTKTNKAAG
jgi:hypothetical protein